MADPSGGLSLWAHAALFWLHCASCTRNADIHSFGKHTDTCANTHLCVRIFVSTRFGKLADSSLLFLNFKRYIRIFSFVNVVCHNDAIGDFLFLVRIWNIIIQTGCYTKCLKTKFGAIADKILFVFLMQNMLHVDGSW